MKAIKSLTIFIMIGVLMYLNAIAQIQKQSNDKTQSMEQSDIPLNGQSNNTDNNTDKNAYINKNGLVTKVPIELDEHIDDVLSSFRVKASELAHNYPESFFTCANTEDKKVALTFDDGPDKRTTERILNILNDFNIPATFFVVGQNVDKYFNVSKEILDSHQLANHSFSHPRPLSITPEQLLKDIEVADKIMKRVKNTEFIYFRPPYGLVNEEQMKVLKQKGYKVIAWSIDSMDWHTDDPKLIEKCVIDNIHPGAIILMHSAGGKNNRESTAQALPHIITKLKSMGYTFTTVEDLLKS